MYIYHNIHSNFCQEKNSIKYTNFHGVICEISAPFQIGSGAEYVFLDFPDKRDSALYASSQEIADAFFAGDADKVSLLLESRLENFVSVRDLAVKAAPENYYHGFLNGIFSLISGNFIHYRPNACAGDGYADIVFGSGDKPEGVIIELNTAQDAKSMRERAAEALGQIQARQYDVAFMQCIKKVYCYGITFCRKSCFVQCEVREL